MLELEISKYIVKAKHMLEQEIHMAKANAKPNRNRETDVRTGN